MMDLPKMPRAERALCVDNAAAEPRASHEEIASGMVRRIHGSGQRTYSDVGMFAAATTRRDAAHRLRRRCSSASGRQQK